MISADQGECWVSSHGDQLPQIQGALKAISETLWAQRTLLPPDLASGLGGAALFLGYLSRRAGFEGAKPQAEALLEFAIEGVARAPRPSLYAGFVGLAWCIEHLNGRVLEAQAEDPNADVDEILLDILRVDGWDADYDLISGLVGIGVYALERCPRPTGMAILDRILHHLERLAVPRGPGLAWPTPPERLPPWQRRLSPQGYLNMGLAHGVPAVLLLLAAMQRVGLDPGRTSPLLAGGMAWFMDQIQTPHGIGHLAGWCPMEETRVSQGPGRIAWCYGDLGASVAMLQTARLAGEAAWEEVALDIARRAAIRPVAEAGVMDVGLCHGSAGNLHVFHRLYRMTGDPLFQDAAGRYLQHVLASRVPGSGFAGFTAYRPPFDEDGASLECGQPHVPAPGLLEGAAGVGLALLATLDPADPAWDRFLLLSTPLPVLPKALS